MPTPTNSDQLVYSALELAGSGKTTEACEVLSKALADHPENYILQHNLAELYRNTGEADKAAAIFTDIIHKHAYFIPSYQSFILILKQKLSEPLSPQDQYACLQQLAYTHNNMGNALMEHGHKEAAIIAYKEALQYLPHYPSAYSNLSNLMRQSGQITEAEFLARRALELRPAFAEAWNNLGTALSEQGRIEEAAQCYKKALQVNPELPEVKHNAGSGSLFLQIYRHDLPTEDIVEAHRSWGASYLVTTCPVLPPIHGKLRIGFISGDFSEHAMMRFVVPLLEKLDRSQFEITCYSNQLAEDAITQGIKALPLTWKNIFALDDVALSNLIINDNLHILVDLSGHTRSNRLYALATKPAAIMAHWLGYMFTSGLPAFDFRITDPWTDPADTAAALHTEQVMHLSQSQFIYRPVDNAPEVNALPALTNGYVTFGSLNNIQKLNRNVIEVWSKLLLQLPKSRLVLQSKILADQGMQGRMRGMFEAFGIKAERLDLLPANSHYLESYHAIDIALDSFPYNGGTTSCDALWMGVPVLNLAGDRSVGRMGVSILTALGLKDWIAHSEVEYIALGIQHSEDLEALELLRHNLRKKFEQSSLRNEHAFAEDFGRCLQRMVDAKS